MGSIDTSSKLKKEDLRFIFHQKSNTKEQLGFEIEIAVLDPKTGKSLPYEGKPGIRALFEEFVHSGIGQPIYKGEILTEVKMDDGAKITFEHGGAIEYCSAVMSNLTQLVVTMQQSLQRLAEVANRINLALVPGGNFPFNTIENVNWMPKPYSIFMRDYFTALGDLGSGGQEVMAHTISTQVTLDYLSEEDFVRKVRTAMFLSPVAVALFANSPLQNGQVSGFLSHRTELWFTTDPQRSGLVLPVLNETFTPDDFIDWALDNKIIYYVTNGQYKEGKNRTFAEVLRQGFPDGRWPTLDDWRTHLCQLWPDVRPRETIELRAPDGPPFDAIPAVPAFWTGILYHPPSCEAILQLFKNFTVEQLQASHSDAAKQGLSAHCGNIRLADLAKTVVSLAEDGLKHRIELGLEAPQVLNYLKPLNTIVATGKTFAESCIEKWNGDLLQSPTRYVEHYRIKW